MPTLQKFSEVTLLEKLVLDPSEVATSRTELGLHSGSIRVAEAGVDWGDAEIAAFMAERERGEAPVDFRIPNRKVTIPLMVGTTNSTTINTARASLQAKVALVQREGGWFKRETTDGRKFYLDVVNATLNMPEHYAHLGYELDVVLTLECIPDLYGSAVPLSLHAGGADPELIFTESDADGDYPGRLGIAVTETSGIDQLGLLWGIRARHYSSAATARLAYSAGTLDALDAATSSGGTITHADLGTGWTPVMSTNIGGTAFMNQTGSYRVWATVQSDDGAAVRARFVWDVGDLTLPVENAPVTIPSAVGFYTLDFGEIRLDPAPVGTHRWQGQIQARGTAGGKEINITRLRFQPLDEGAGRLVASAASVEGLNDSVARDGFTGGGGTLNGRTADLGGTWISGGAAVDFSLNGTTAARSESDGSSQHALLGTTDYADVLYQADLRISDTTSSSNTRMDLIARHGGTWPGDPFFVVSWYPTHVVGINLRASGPDIDEWATVPWVNDDDWVTVRLMITSAGNWFVWWALRGAAFGDPVLSGSHEDLAAGGTIETGNVGLRDDGEVAATREYDNVVVSVPTTDAVLYAGGSASLRTDGMYRFSADGLGPGPVSRVIGDLPRLPPSGLENRVVEVMLVPSTGDFDQLPDTAGTAGINAQLEYRASWLMIAG